MDGPLASAGATGRSFHNFVIHLKAIARCAHKLQLERQSVLISGPLALLGLMWPRPTRDRCGPIKYSPTARFKYFLPWWRPDTLTAYCLQLVLSMSLCLWGCVYEADIPSMALNCLGHLCCSQWALVFLSFHSLFPFIITHFFPFLDSIYRVYILTWYTSTPNIPFYKALVQGTSAQL